MVLGRELTQSCEKNPTSTEQFKKQHDNIKNTTKNFDYTTIADRLRTVSWSNSSHPTGHLIPSPFLGLACAPIIETRFLELAMSLLDL